MSSAFLFVKNQHARGIQKRSRNHAHIRKIENREGNKRKFDEVGHRSVEDAVDEGSKPARKTIFPFSEETETGRLPLR